MTQLAVYIYNDHSNDNISQTTHNSPTNHPSQHVLQPQHSGPAALPLPIHGWRHRRHLGINGHVPSGRRQDQNATASLHRCCWCFRDPLQGRHRLSLADRQEGGPHAHVQGDLVAYVDGGTKESCEIRLQ